MHIFIMMLYNWHDACIFGYQKVKQYNNQGGLENVSQISPHGKLAEPFRELLALCLW